MGDEKKADCAVYLHLGEIAVASQRYSEGHDWFVSSLDIWRTWRGLVGVGVCCIEVGNYTDGECALCEASVINGHQGDVWAYLSLCYARSGPAYLEEALSALKEALRLSFSDALLLTRIAEQLQHIGAESEAESLKIRIAALSEQLPNENS